MRVKKIMNKAMVTDNNIKLRDAAKVMSSKRIGSLIVMRKDKIVGIITERDIMRNVNKLDSSIKKVMSKNVITIDEGESIDNAALLMSKHKIKRLPVLKGGKLVGIITATNLLAHSDELGADFFFG